MRTMRRVGVALLTALALSTPVFAQSSDNLGLTADYRTFFVHRADDTPHVNRFTTGLTFSLK